MIRLLVVRHGQSTWNADGRWQGQADPPLSELGERQAHAAVPATATFDAVWSSDLARARRTAELVAPIGVEVRGDARIRERHAGEWTGLTRAEIDEQYPGYLDGRRSPPGFEADGSVIERVLEAFGDIAASIDGGMALVVSHGGVIRALERHFGVNDEPVPNLGGRWLDHNADGLVLGERELLIDPHDVQVTVPRQL